MLHTILSTCASGKRNPCCCFSMNSPPARRGASDRYQCRRYSGCSLALTTRTAQHSTTAFVFVWCFFCVPPPLCPAGARSIYVFGDGKPGVMVVVVVRSELRLPSRSWLGGNSVCAAGFVSYCSTASFYLVQPLFSDSCLAGYRSRPRLPAPHESCC